MPHHSASPTVANPGIGGVLGVVGDQGTGDQDPACHDGDPAQPVEQATRPFGCHRQASQASQAEQDHEPARLGAGEQEPRGGGDHHEQVKAAESGAPVVLEMPGVHDIVDHEHQPGGDADHGTDPVMGFRGDDERQDGRHDDRQSHPGVEALQEGGVACRAGLARPVLYLSGDIHGLDRARAAGAQMPGSRHHKRSRGLLPPRPARCGQALEGEQGGRPGKMPNLHV